MLILGDPNAFHQFKWGLYRAWSLNSSLNRSGHSGSIEPFCDISLALEYTIRIPGNWQNFHFGPLIWNKDHYSMKTQVEALGNPLLPYIHTPESKQKSLLFWDEGELQRLVTAIKT